VCLPTIIYAPLGLDPRDANVGLTSGVASSKIPTLFANVTIDIGVTSFEAYSGFTTGLDHLAIGLLGQSGFFDKCKITFDYQNKLFIIDIP
jgi:hypothetical protein